MGKKRNEQSAQIKNHLKKVKELLTSTTEGGLNSATDIRRLLLEIDNQLISGLAKNSDSDMFETNLYKYIFEKSPIGILYFDKNTVITACNHRFTEILGTTQKKVVGLKLTELPDKEVVEAVKKALKGEKSEYEGNYMSVTSGNTVPIRVIFHPLKSNGGTLTGGIATIEDITERYIALEKLMESENKYHSLFENKHIVMLIIDPDNGQILEANPAAVEFYGWPRETLKRMKISDIDTLSPEEINGEIDSAKKEKRNVFHFKHRLADGSVRDVEVFSGLNKRDGKLVVFSIVHDISKRVKVQKELLKFKLGIERSSNIVFITDKEGQFQYINPSFKETYGYSLDELGDKTPRILKSGMQKEEFYDRFWETILNGHVMEGEVINKTKEGELLDVKFSSNPIIDDDGNLLGFIAIQEDITDKKKKDQQLRKSLKEKELLLSEIHHRVKNNLAIISALLELNLYQQDGLSMEEFIVNSQLRIKTMASVHELLYKSNTFAEISFQEYIVHLISMVQSTIQTEGISPEFIVNVDDVNLNINQAVPCGLILNELITNSLRHAFPDRKEGKVKVSLCSNKKILTLSVEDNGIGLPSYINFENAQSMGITLIRILSTQLEADVKIGNTKEGFKCTVVFEAKDELKGSTNNLYT